MVSEAGFRFYSQCRIGISEKRPYTEEDVMCPSLRGDLRPAICKPNQVRGSQQWARLLCLQTVLSATKPIRDDGCTLTRTRKHYLGDGGVGEAAVAWAVETLHTWRGARSEGQVTGSHERPRDCQKVLPIPGSKLRGGLGPGPELSVFRGWAAPCQSQDEAGFPWGNVKRFCVTQFDRQGNLEAGSISYEKIKVTCFG